MSGVDELLGNLEADGVLDSQGGFTVDLRNAQAKLEKYRLAAPSHYVLSLLSSAVSSGAKTFYVEKSRGACNVGFDGQSFAVTELKRLFENMVLGTMSPDPRLRDLGLAVQGARRLEPRSLEIESGVGHQGVRLLLESHTVTIEPLGEKTSLGSRRGFPTKFRLNGSAGPWEIFKAGLGLGGQEEIKLLRRRGRYATCNVYVGKEKLNNRRLGPWKLAAKLEGRPRMPEFSLLSERLFPMKGNDTVSGYLGFGSESGGWIVIDNGITFQLSTDHSAYVTSRAVLYTEGLARDLSGSGLVRNESFQVLADQVDKHLDSLVLRTNADSRGLSAETKEFIAPLVLIAKSRRAVQS